MLPSHQMNKLFISILGVVAAGLLLLAIALLGHLLGFHIYLSISCMCRAELCTHQQGAYSTLRNETKRNEMVLYSVSRWTKASSKAFSIVSKPSEFKACPV